HNLVRATNATRVSTAAESARLAGERAGLSDAEIEAAVEKAVAGVERVTARGLSDEARAKLQPELQTSSAFFKGYSAAEQAAREARISRALDSDILFRARYNAELEVRDRELRNANPYVEGNYLLAA